MKKSLLPIEAIAAKLNLPDAYYEKRSPVTAKLSLELLDAELADAQRGERRLFGRLHHNGIAGCQRRRQLPSLHQQGKIPRDDLANHADRFVARVSKVIAVHRDRFTL